MQTEFTELPNQPTVPVSRYKLHQSEPGRLLNTKAKSRCPFTALRSPMLFSYTRFTPGLAQCFAHPPASPAAFCTWRYLLAWCCIPYCLLCAQTWTLCLSVPLNWVREKGGRTKPSEFFRAVCAQGLTDSPAFSLPLQSPGSTSPAFSQLLALFLRRQTESYSSLLFG